MLTATNENGTVVFTYDNRGRVSSVTDVWGKLISYSYDANGNKTQMSIGNRTTTYQYDSLNRLTGMYENTGNTAVFAYDNAGRLQTRTLNSLLVTTYAYNGLDLPTTINYMVGASTLANFAYEYGTDLNVSKITDRNGNHFYYYDDNSQLVSATHSTFATESFSYDEIGNHINQDGTTPPPQNISYEYDLNGDLKARIDPAGNPEPNKNIVYKYDALGRLVARVNGTQWTRYTYDGDDAVLDEKSDGTLIYYGNGPGIDNKLWYMQGTSSPVFFLADHLGSTRALVSPTGSIIAETLIDYDSFGKPSISLPTRFQYAGREYDPDTQLYYYRARWYDPQARRFISEDPIGLQGGINLHAYVGNNPINFIDPKGLENTPPIGGGPNFPAGPPFGVPGAPDSHWVWSPDPMNSRQGAFRPDTYPKTSGGIPSVSWETPTAAGGEGHWDLDLGIKNQTIRFLKDGTPVTAREAHACSAGQAFKGIRATGRMLGFAGFMLDIYGVIDATKRASQNGLNAFEQMINDFYESAGVKGPYRPADIN